MINKIERHFHNVCEVAELEINWNWPADPQIIDRERFYRALSWNPLMALWETYWAWYWWVEQLDTTITQLLKSQMNETQPTLMLSQRVSLAIYFLLKRFWNWQLARPKEVAQRHYDIWEDFWKASLWNSMKYTSAYWFPEYWEFDLDRFQELDLKIICERLGLEEGMKVLDIWFGFWRNTKYMVENYWVDVTWLTISQEQKSFAEKECADISDKTHFHLKSWSDINPEEIWKFDRVVSLESIENVWPKNYDAFFRFISNSLNDDWVVLLQAINWTQSTFATIPFIDKYIFPNGATPYLPWVFEAANNAWLNLRLVDNSLGLAYDKTLIWWNGFRKEWDTLKEKYRNHFDWIFPYEITDNTFALLQEYYFLSCAWGFRAWFMHDWHFVWTKSGSATSYNDIVIPRNREEVDKFLGKK